MVAECSFSPASNIAVQLNTFQVSSIAGIENACPPHFSLFVALLFLISVLLIVTKSIAVG